MFGGHHLHMHEQDFELFMNENLSDIFNEGGAKVHIAFGQLVYYCFRAFNDIIINMFPG